MARTSKTTAATSGVVNTLSHHFVHLRAVRQTKGAYLFEEVDSHGRSTNKVMGSAYFRKAAFDQDITIGAVITLDVTITSFGDGSELPYKDAGQG